MKKIILICSALLFQISFAQTFNVEPILQSGSNDNRINLVILSEGYQSNELNQFVTDATNFTTSLFAQTPYKEYKNYFNVYAIKVPSVESGADHPGTATDVTEPDHPVQTVNTYFQSTFDYFNIHRLLVVNNTIVSTVLANNFPAYDQAIILVNSPHYGGSGGQFPVASLGNNANEIAIHELGHSFVDLLDEYYPGDVFASEGINMTQNTNAATVRWKNWMGIDGVGIYQHCCGGNSAAWYRPHQDCKMRVLGSPFCAVCTEGTIEKIHAITTAVDSFLPENTGVVNMSTALDFEVNTIETIPNTLNIEWKLNGAVINSQDFMISILPSDMILGNNQLQATIHDDNPLLKVDAHESLHFTTILWNINATTMSIDDISLENLKVVLFPNPTQDILYIDVKKEIHEDYDVIISDLTGKQLMTKRMTYMEQRPEIQLASLPSGTYFFNLKFESGLSFSKKIIKN